MLDHFLSLAHFDVKYNDSIPNKDDSISLFRLPDIIIKVGWNVTIAVQSCKVLGFKSNSSSVLNENNANSDEYITVKYCSDPTPLVSGEKPRSLAAVSHKAHIIWCSGG